MLLIKNGKVFTKEGCFLEKADILIENGKIKDIAESITEISEVDIIDAEGKFVMPGFIDAHCHLGMKEDSIGFEGNDVNEVTDPITPHLRAIDAINPMDKTFEEAYQGGITCVASGPGSANIIGGQFAIIKTYGKRIDNMIVKEPAAVKCAFGENPKMFYGKNKKFPATRMAIAAKLREALMKCKEYNEKLEKAENKNLRKPAFDMKMEALRPVIKGEIPLKAHVHRADDIFTAIRIAKEFGIKMTLDHCTSGNLIVDCLKEEDFDLIVGPSFGYRSKFELMEKSFVTPAILSNSGKKIAITTDSPVVPIHRLPLCAGLAVNAGMDEREALKAITIYPAQILGIENQVGSLEIEKDADIVIWNGNPLKLESSVFITIVEGKIVYSKTQGDK